MRGACRNDSSMPEAFSNNSHGFAHGEDTVLELSLEFNKPRPPKLAPPLKAARGQRRWAVSAEASAKVDRVRRSFSEGGLCPP